MIPHFLEPKICQQCDREDCDGDYLKCLQDIEDGRADYEYERMRDERE